LVVGQRDPDHSRPCQVAFTANPPSAAGPASSRVLKIGS
jgi:hypothetical protein